MSQPQTNAQTQKKVQTQTNTQIQTDPETQADPRTSLAERNDTSTPRDDAVNTAAQGQTNAQAQISAVGANPSVRPLAGSGITRKSLTGAQMSSTTYKSGVQYYMEAGGFGKKTAEAAGAVLDRIRNGEVSWNDLSNTDISALYSVISALYSVISALYSVLVFTILHSIAIITATTLIRNILPQGR